LVGSVFGCKTLEFEALPKPLDDICPAARLLKYRDVVPLRSLFERPASDEDSPIAESVESDMDSSPDLLDGEGIGLV
jgi:hypothetical protein